MKWTLLYMFVFLKIPIGLLAWLIWWAIHNVDEPEVATSQDDGDGGIGRLDGRVDHPRGPKPRPARRGPHPGEPPAPAPARTRAPGRSRTPSTR